MSEVRRIDSDNIKSDKNSPYSHKKINVNETHRINLL